MASNTLPEPPSNVPRIVDVLEPSSGHYVVYVRMTTNLASKWPSKPWGTPIENIGLSEKDAALYPGYTLVGIEPMKGSPDLYWVFEKLPGPVLQGKQAYVERTVADTAEKAVAPGTAAESGLLIVDSKVMPDGKGKSVRRTVSVDAWPEHVGSRWDDDLQAQVAYTEQFVDPPQPADLLEEFTSFQIVNEDRSNKIVEVVPTNALDNYLVRHPVRVDLSDLPRELLSVEVIWNEGYSIGVQDYSFYAWRSGESFSLGKSASDAANSAASVSCELSLRFRDVASQNLFGERLLFYVPEPVTTASVLEKLSTILTPATVSLWPVFKPESETIITTGQSVSVRSNVQISLGGTVSDGGLTGQEWDRGSSDDYQINTNNSAVQLPACIHGPITIGGGTSMSRSVAATAFMGMFNSLVGSISVSRTKTGTASGGVSPTYLAEVDGPTSIPVSGIYLMDMNITPRQKYGYFPVTAIVFDASNLA